MRRRITRAFFTAAAAGATITTLGFAAASPAGAAAGGIHFNPSAPQVATNANADTLGGDCGASGDETGTWSSTDCGKAGYVATGRDFRYAQALITVPNHGGSLVNDPTMYVSLDSSGINNDFARAGIEPCTVASPACPQGWQAFVLIEEPGSVVSHTFPLGASTEGDGVFVSVYLVPTGNSVHVEIIPPDGIITNNTYTVNGPVYTDAQALADWTTASGQPAPKNTSPNPKTRDTQFFQGRFTTSNGVQGTFKGPWTLTAVDATSNGSLPPSGTLIAQPSYLWNDGHSLGGLGNDAFGVWRSPF
jgi:hypothetical protein